MAEKKKKISTKKDVQNEKEFEMTPAMWAGVLIAVSALVILALYWGYTTQLKSKELRAMCYDVQEELKNSQSFRQCGCSPTPADAYDPDQAEAYNKTTRGCTCNCVLADGSKRSFDIRIAK